MLWAVSPDRTVCLTGSSPCCILGDKEGALSKANVAISSMAPVEDKISPVGIASISPSLRRASDFQPLYLANFSTGIPTLRAINFTVSNGFATAIW